MKDQTLFKRSGALVALWQTTVFLMVIWAFWLGIVIWRGTGQIEHVKVMEATAVA